jgi:hypothetical protein
VELQVMLRKVAASTVLLFASAAISSTQAHDLPQLTGKSNSS